MLKHKYFLFLILGLPFFFITSCAKPTNPCEIINDDANIKVDISKSEFKDGESLEGYIKVYYFEQELTWAKKDYQNEGSYFITTSRDYPTTNIFTDLTIRSNVEKNNLDFYVAHYEISENKIHVSNKQTLVVTNDNAIKPWVWFTITGVVIFGVVAMVVFTRRYKATH